MNTTPPDPHDPLAAARRPEASTPPRSDDLAAHLPDFEILDLLGQGGMGAVYRVRRRADGAMLALKVVRPPASIQADAFVQRFAREAEALARLRHPHIVAIHGHGRGGPWCWLLMDLIEGANLREVVATGRLSPAQTLALVSPLCSALQYAHDQGVVHRDLKPENILLDAAGVPHLVDFGLAKLHDHVPRSALTQSGSVMGTVHYMAPEQVESAKNVDHRADIYAFGVVLYELLTGRLPLGRFEAPSQRVQVDVRIDEVVLKALERDPERRWQQMRQVGQAVLDAGTPAASSSRPSTAALRPWLVRDRILLALPIIVGVGIAVMLFADIPVGPVVMAAIPVGLIVITAVWARHARRPWVVWMAALGALTVVLLVLFLSSPIVVGARAISVAVTSQHQSSHAAEAGMSRADAAWNFRLQHDGGFSVVPSRQGSPIFLGTLGSGITARQRHAFETALGRPLTLQVEADVPMVLRHLGEASGLDIVFAVPQEETVGRRISLNARDVSLEKVLRMLATEVKVGYVFTGETLIVDPRIYRQHFSDAAP